MAEMTQLLIERRWTLFVDGENFTRRGQDVLSEADLRPVKESAWRKDVFLWLPGVTATTPFISPSRFYSPYSPKDGEPPARVAPAATRAYYYSSTTSDEPEWTDARLTMRGNGFEPRLFKRVRGRSKAVDVALATDVLTLAGEGQYDVAVIFAGDGDYVPVVEAVKRLGRHVVVGFFAAKGHGLSDELRIAADDFVDLTPHLIMHWRSHQTERERQAVIAANAARDAAPSEKS
jgi:uncharacterized LabA/DUF88 family protein